MTAPRQPTRSPRSGPDPRRNSVGLDERGLADILDQFDASAPATASPQRNYRRFSFRHTSIALVIQPPGGDAHVVDVASRNISCFGMSLVHSAFLHAGTRCVANLPGKQGGPLRVQATVVRCSHRVARIHEIGLRFDSAIDLKGLLTTDPFGDWCSLEHVDPSRLSGTIVHAEPCDRERDIVRHFLRETSLSIRKAASVAEAVAASQGTDLIIAEYSLADGTAERLCTELKAANRGMPLLIVTSASDKSERTRIADTPADGFLAKPIQQESLLRALGEFLLLGRADAPVEEAQAPAPDVLEHALRELRRHAPSLKDAANCGDAAAARELCRHIARAAGDAGLSGIARDAQSFAESGGRLAPDTLTTLRASIEAALEGTKKAA